MRAAICEGPRRFRIGERPRPEPGPGEVRIRPSACGICGSDLSLYELGYLGPDIVPGHEFAGRVEQLGAGVDDLALGDFVAVEPLASCGRCADCQAGFAARCREARFIGVHRDGGFAEGVVVPRARCFRLPGDLPAPVAALAEPLAVALRGLRRAGLAAGERVLVLGAGNLGLLTTLAARELGAGEVWTSARHPQQARLAETFGAARVLREAEAEPMALDRLGREHAIDRAVETVGGSANTLQAGIAALRPGGTLSVLGLFDAGLQIEPYSLFAKELTLAWSNCYEHSRERADFEIAIDLLGRRRELLAELTTRQFGLDAIGAAFEAAGDKRSGALKVTVLP